MRILALLAATLTIACTPEGALSPSLDLSDDESLRHLPADVSLIAGGHVQGVRRSPLFDPAAAGEAEQQ